MKRDIRDYLDDILNSFEEVEEFTLGMSFEDFIRDRKTLNAVIRSLEVMGEAAKKVPEEIREQHPDIPWKYMAGMRDKLIHEYHAVDLEIIWAVITEELPPLKSPLRRLSEEMKR